MGKMRTLCGTWDPVRAMDCVFDGVTPCEGAYASGFTKDLLARGAIGSLDDASALLQQANEVLFRSGREESC